MITQRVIPRRKYVILFKCNFKRNRIIKASKNIYITVIKPDPIININMPPIYPVSTHFLITNSSTPKGRIHNKFPKKKETSDIIYNFIIIK